MNKNWQLIFDDNGWYNTTQAYKTMLAAGSRMSRSTFWRRVSSGAIRWHRRVNFAGKWFKGRDLNQFFNTCSG